MAAISSSAATLFVKNDAGYLAWLAANRDGYVVNCNARPVATYLVLHRATCSWVNPPRYKNWTTVGYMKVCARTVAELATWARTTTGGTLRPCPSCRPAKRSAGLDERDRSDVVGAVSQGDAAASQPGNDLEQDEHALVLRSGLSIKRPLDRLLRFCREEFPYYDGVADLDPNHVLPIDVMVTIAMNSFIDKATQVRRIHRGLAAACDGLLEAIPINADLLSYDPSLNQFEQLIHAAVQVPEVLVPRAVKVLHRKRRGYIPMLDTVVINHYLEASRQSALKEQTQDKRRAATVAVEVLKGFRDDLSSCTDQIEALRAELTRAGYPLTPVRILEVLVWTETEPHGYYRAFGRPGTD